MEVEKGHAIGALVTGLITGVCGFSSFICGCLWVSHHGGGGFGIWTGFGMLIIAVLGIVVFVKRNKCAGIAFLILNIFFIILCSVQAALAALAALLFAIWIEALEHAGCSTYNGKCQCNSSTSVAYDLGDCDELYIMRNSLTAIMAFNAIAVISTFAGSIVGCCISCCAKQETVVQPVVLVNQPPQQVVITQGPPPQGAAPPPAY